MNHTTPLPENIRRYLDEARICRVATSGPDGAHVAPFCHAMDGSTIYIETTSERKTVRNLQHDPRVVVLVDDYVEDWRRLKLLSVSGTGRGLTTEMGGEFDRAARLLREKFPQFHWLHVEISFVLAIDVTGMRASQGVS